MISVVALGAEDQQEMVYETEMWKSAKKHPLRKDLEKVIEKVAEAHRDLGVAARGESKCRARACWVASERVTYIAS